MLKFIVQGAFTDAVMGDVFLSDPVWVFRFDFILAFPILKRMFQHSGKAGTSALDGLAVKLEDKIIPSLSASSEHLSATATREPCRASSELFLSWAQSLCGSFVGYQVALDVAYVFPAWFDSNSHVYVGPGVPSEIARIFPESPWSSCGMVANKSISDACVPFCFELHQLCQSHPAAAPMRRCLQDLRLGFPHVNDIEYWGCEVRQLRHNRRYNGTGLCAEWYTHILSTHPRMWTVLGRVR